MQKPGHGGSYIAFLGVRTGSQSQRGAMDGLKLGVQCRGYIQGEIISLLSQTLTF